MADTPIATLQHVYYRYQRSSPGWVLDGIHLQIEPGSFVLLCGASGSGKSTLARLFNGLVPHFYPGSFKGQVLVAGQDTRAHTIGDLCALVAMVFQNPEAQVFTRSVEREIAFGLESLAIPAHEIPRRVQASADLVGIASLLSRNPRHLSGGEQQLVVLAAALALRPAVLVLDEPYASLDPLHVQRVRQALRESNRHGTTIVLTEHRLQHAIADADRMIVLQDGHIVLDGPPQHVLQEDIAVSGLEVPPVVQAARAGGLPLLPLNVAAFAAAVEAYGTLGIPAPMPEPQHPNTAEQSLISMEHVAFVNGKTPVLQDINLEVKVGECLAIVGANGAGKTTLIKHLNGLYRPTHGTVRVLGQPTHRTKVSRLAHHVGVAFQNPNSQFFMFRVWDEIAAGAHALKRSDEAWLREVVELFGLEPLLERSPYRLSEGEKRRVAFASVLAGRPDVLVLDEPTAGQDAAFRQKLASVLLRLRADGHSIVLVTHDLDFAEQVADRWLLLAAGRIQAQGRPWEVMSDTAAMTRAHLEPTQAFQVAALLQRAGRQRSRAEEVHADP